MDGNNSRAKILGDVNTAIGSLEFPEKKPLASIQKATPSSGVAPLTVNLEAKLPDSGANPNYSYSWSASDGQKADGATTSMTFNTAGTYTITLTVKNGSKEGCTSLEKTVTVEEPKLLSVDITCNGAKSCDVPYGGTVSLEVHYSNVGEGGWLNINGSNVSSGVNLAGGYKYVLPTGDGILKLILENYSPIFKCWQNEAGIWPSAGDGQRTASKIDVAKVTLLGKENADVPCYFRLRETSGN
jgi:PKD repeat protein